MKLPFYYGWIIVFASFFCLFTFGVFESYGVFFKPLIDEFGWSRALTSTVFSIYAILYSISAVIMGRLTDKYGPRKVVIAGSFIVGAGLVLSSQINSIFYLYLFWGVASFGSGVIYIPPISAVLRWFKERKGLAVGIATSGNGVGILLMAPIATILTLNYGWRITFIILGIVFLSILLVAAIMIKSNPKLTGRDIRVKERASDLSLKQTILTKSFLMLYFIYFSASLCFSSIAVHIVPLALDIGISSVESALALGLIGGGLIGGTVIMGFISDKIGRWTTLTVCLLVQTSIIPLLFFANNVWMLYVFAIIFGFSNSGSWIMQAPIIEETFGLKSFGINIGVMSTTFGVGGIFGPIMFGYIFDVSGTYQSGLVFCLLITIVAASLSYLLKKSHVTLNL